MPRAKQPAPALSDDGAVVVSVRKDEGVFIAWVVDDNGHYRFTYTKDARHLVTRVETMLEFTLLPETYVLHPEDDDSRRAINRSKRSASVEDNETDQSDDETTE